MTLDRADLQRNFFTSIMTGRFGLNECHRDGRVSPERLKLHPCLSIHALYRAGALVEGATTTLQMADGSSRRAIREAGNLNLEGQLIPIRSHQALRMRMFGCPQCGSDRYKLFMVNDIWACRDCHQLLWPSRHTHRSIPALHRIAWLRRRLNADPRPFTPLPAKPPHCRRHWRLAREIRALEARLIEHGRDIASVLSSRHERS